MKNFLLLQNSLDDGNSSCPSSPARWCIGGSDEDSFCIENPTLAPLCILALIIGLFTSKRIAQLPGQFRSRWFYHITFFLYGMMMTSAGIFHCFLADQQKLSDTLQNTDPDLYQFIRTLFIIIDTGLTTNIAISFLFCGLSDIRFFNPQLIAIRFLLFILYFISFFLWTIAVLKNCNWLTNVLYTGVIGVCGFIYLLTQLSIKSNRSALPALFTGGIYAAIGLYATAFGAEHICKFEGPFWSLYIGPEFIWDLLADISVTFVFMYVIRANRQKEAMTEDYEIEFEDKLEKF